MRMACIVGSALTTLMLVAFGAGAATWEAKVAPEVLDAARLSAVEFLVVLTEQADLAPAASIRRKNDKGSFVYAAARGVVERTQAPLRARLTAAGVEYQSFWVTNMLWVRGDARTLEDLARDPAVARIVADAPLRREVPRIDRAQALPSFGPLGRTSPASTVEWNVAQIGAPEVWAMGVTGQGAVVGGMDTGYQWDHPALRRQYRGTELDDVRHDYNWHDAIHSNGSFECPPDAPAPCDGDLTGHGTHTMGTIVGDDGAGNQIGAAPGARWIGCRCWEEAERTALRYVTECFQWFIAPTDLQGLGPDPARAPHVINNSWICDPEEGCADPNILRGIVQTVRAAGIFVAAGAGNDGPGCSTVAYPPAIYEIAFSVGATTRNDGIAAFSSRGPVESDGSGRLKPDLVAPGAEIRSSVPNGGYAGGWSGTSMATPLVSAAVALIVSAVPVLAGQVDTIETLLVDTAVPLTAAQTCGDVPGTEIPNNIFGHGRLDVLAAVRAARRTDIGDGHPDPTPDTPPLRTTALQPNRPNPFNPGTTLEYSVGATGRVTLVVYDIAGRRVRNLEGPRYRAPGLYSSTWDGRDDAGRDLPSGLYVVRLRVGAVQESRTVTLLR